jgi:hypothetical protein
VSVTETMKSAGPNVADAGFFPLSDLRGESGISSSKKLSPVIDWEAIPPTRGGATAKSATFFQNYDRSAGRSQTMGGMESAKTGSDNEDFAFHG